MKKLFLALLTVGFSASAASAQVEIGLRLSPAVTSLRADGSANNFEGKSKLSIGGGLVVDYFFGENYAFSTGLDLVGKGGKLTYTDGSNRELKVGAQYLQLPLTIKLFTNDITTDTKLYFQLGGYLAGNIGTRIDGEKEFKDPGSGETFKSNKFLLIPDAGVLAGFGAEYQVGQSTKVFAGLRYQRGLPNIDNYFGDERKFSNVVIKNSEFALDLGMKF
ncbi:PorT family protein [Hymenobacter lutimineralis]|uniref:PorT family protein n=1 Tax=Hymenobacter lutimineralis TaxID=2606448 RepID=A0A5D6UU01_9BACT|nr:MULTISPECIES: porin family protein [Hymenobacter]QIX62063.1 PorT family protein [Hymenobacter sp. BT18]TYZ07026.1 PorT family protein [Hymenobacter lutimineralis]